MKPTTLHGAGSKLHRVARRARQRGATAIEFGLVALFFFSLMMGIVDFGRWLHAMNSANEATRLGARIAATCDANAPGIRTRMTHFLPGGVNSGDIDVNYGNCPGAGTGICSVTVALNGVTIPGIAWYLPDDLPIPPTSITLPTESLLTNLPNGGGSNALCG
jgi:Flp pilus assembly pilin Flp